MRFGSPKVFGLCCLLCTAAFAANGQTVVEKFENASEWVVTGNDLANGATVTSATTTAAATEGTGSVEFTYNYSGLPYYEIKIAKSFATPLDLSDAVQFDVDLKGNAAASNVVWFIGLRSANGQSIQMLHSGNDADYEQLPLDNFKRWSFSLSEFRWGGYYTTTHLNQVDLGRITEIALFMQAQGTVSSAGSAMIAIDNLVAHTTSSRQTVDVLESFNYPDSNALQAVWQPTLATGDNTASVALGTDMDGTGGALDLTFNVGHQYDRMGALYQLPAPRDFSNVDAFQVILEGDTDLPSSVARYAGLVMRDGSGNEALWYFSSPLDKGRTGMVLVNNFSAPPIQYWVAPLHDYEWDGGTVPFDHTYVTHLAVTFTDSNAAGYPHSFTLKVDEIKTITSLGLPKVSDITSSNVADWTLY